MSQPDILIFLSDQHSGSVMGCAGADIDTPNLDAIAREGVIFDNAYTPCPLIPVFISTRIPFPTLRQLFFIRWWRPDMKPY